MLNGWRLECEERKKKRYERGRLERETEVVEEKRKRGGLVENVSFSVLLCWQGNLKGPRRMVARGDRIVCRDGEGERVVKG